jgi:hypothetical protein
MSRGATPFVGRRQPTAPPVARHWYDLPLIALPMLRPLRVLRVLAFARMVNRCATGGLVERAAVYVAGVALMAVGLGSGAILDAEQNAPEPTSPASATPCGGRAAPSRQWDTETATQSQPRAV